MSKEDIRKFKEELVRKYGIKKAEEIIKDAEEIAEIVPSSKIIDDLLYYIEVQQGEVEKHSDHTLLNAIKTSIDHEEDLDPFVPELINRAIKRPISFDRHLQEIIKYMRDHGKSNTYEIGVLVGIWMCLSFMR